MDDLAKHVEKILKEECPGMFKVFFRDGFGWSQDANELLSGVTNYTPRVMGALNGWYAGRDDLMKESFKFKPLETGTKVEIPYTHVKGVLKIREMVG
ncbi:hypothetical protein HYX05_02855 [Candidatus Woesearchaeota archaeon]|nr:hypothetical protein [Candidatus Woesearchaeota archaeon]